MKKFLAPVKIILVIVTAIIAVIAFVVWMYWPSSALPRKVPAGQWFACQTDQDCMLVREVCGGIGSINTRYGTEWDRYVADLAPLVECDAPRDQVSDFSAQCAAQRCIAKPNGIDTTQWQTYRNEEYGFEFKYPREWTGYGSIEKLGKKAFFVNSDTESVGILPQGEFDRGYPAIKPEITQITIDNKGAQKSTWKIKNTETVIIIKFTTEISSWSNESRIELRSSTGESTLNQILSTFKFISQDNPQFFKEDIQSCVSASNFTYEFYVAFSATTTAEQARDILSRVSAFSIQSNSNTYYFRLPDGKICSGLRLLKASNGVIQVDTVPYMPTAAPMY